MFNVIENLSQTLYKIIKFCQVEKFEQNVYTPIFTLKLW